MHHLLFSKEKFFVNPFGSLYIILPVTAGSKSASESGQVTLFNSSFIQSCVDVPNDYVLLAVKQIFISSPLGENPPSDVKST